MLHGFSLSNQKCSIICKIQIGEVMISHLDTKVCRVHGLLHHIVNDHNEHNGDNMQPCQTPETMVKKDVMPVAVLMQQLELLSSD